MAESSASLQLLAIASFSHARMAQGLADYLTTENIPAHVVQKDMTSPHAQSVDATSQATSAQQNNQAQNNESNALSYFVVISQESLLPRAKEIAKEFVDNPEQEKYFAASWQRNEVADLGYASSFLGFADGLKKSGKVTLTVLILVTLLQLLVSAGFMREIVGALHFPMQLFGISFADMYRLWTPALLHGDWAHLVFNAFWWWWLGQRIEAQEGSRRLINLALITGLLAHLAQFIFIGANFVGLSGVVYGLFAYVWLVGNKDESITSYFIPNSMMGMLVGWMLLGFADVLWISMANWAHLGGLLTGLLCGACYLYCNQRQKDL